MAKFNPAELSVEELQEKKKSFKKRKLIAGISICEKLKAKNTYLTYSSLNVLK